MTSAAETRHRHGHHRAQVPRWWRWGLPGTTPTGVHPLPGGRSSRFYGEGAIPYRRSVGNRCGGRRRAHHGAEMGIAGRESRSALARKWVRIPPAPPGHREVSPQPPRAPFFFTPR